MLKESHTFLRTQGKESLWTKHLDGYGKVACSCPRQEGQVEKMRPGNKKYFPDKTEKGFIFGPFKESALSALCNHEENLEDFN